MASWIEICVDCIGDILHHVEAYMASWIEIPAVLVTMISTVSRLIWPRGLKSE